MYYIPNNVGKCKVMLKAYLHGMMQPPYDMLTTRKKSYRILKRVLKPYDNVA